MSQLGSAEASLELSSPPWKESTACPVEGKFCSGPFLLGAGLERQWMTSAERPTASRLRFDCLYKLGVLLVGVVVIRALRIWGLH